MVGREESRVGEFGGLGRGRENEGKIWGKKNRKIG